MIARIRDRLNEIERRHPVAFAIGIVLACDAVLCVALAIARPFA